jgi:hypothetical protein
MGWEGKCRIGADSAVVRKASALPLGFRFEQLPPVAAAKSDRSSVKFISARIALGSFHP